MISGLSEAISNLGEEKGLSRELIKKTVEDILLVAYKKHFGTIDNAVIKFDKNDNVVIYSKKKVVEDVYEEVKEVELADALKLNSDSEIGDELLIEINPLKDFDHAAIQAAMQRAKQLISDIHKDTIFSEFLQKKGQIIIGYCQRIKNNNIFVDLGRAEGVLLKTHQSSRDMYKINDRIKALVYDVSKKDKMLSIVLSRTDKDFVYKLFENEVPEIYDGVIEVIKIVREPGLRTKISVMSKREEVDPVGSCVGQRGVRIDPIIKELGGEKIDIIKFDHEPARYIANSLSPAVVEQVIILDPETKKALAVVKDTQFSIAIGKQGLNVRLANRLVDWNIDVKTMAQFEEMDITSEAKKAASSLFSDAEVDEITNISELDGLSEKIVDILNKNNIMLIEELINLTDEDFGNIAGLSEEDIEIIKKVIDDNVEIVEEDYDDIIENQDSEDFDDDNLDGESDREEDENLKELEVYECPECGADVTEDMKICPKCKIELSFEELEE